MNRHSLINMIVYSCLFAAGCSVIAGREDAALQDGERIKLQYVETLRNQASLSGASLLDSDPNAPPATSIQRPIAVAADPFRVYVADRFPIPRLAVFDRGERTLSFITGPTPTTPLYGSKFIDPSGVAVDAQGRVYLADARLARVFGMDRKGTLLLSIGHTGELAFPSALAVDTARNRLYIADKHAGGVLVYSDYGVFQSEIGGHAEKGGIKEPVALAVDRRGTCYILDGRRKAVFLYDANGAFIRKLRVTDETSRASMKLSGIAVDSDGHIYISDSNNGSIIILNPDGTFLRRWGTTGTRREDFWNPSGLFIDGRDTVYIADEMNGRIQVYQYVK